MSQQSVRQAARRSALDAPAVRPKERATGNGIEGLAVEVIPHSVNATLRFATPSGAPARRCGR